MDVIIKRCQSAVVSLDTSSCVQGSVQLSPPGRLLSPDNRTFFDEAFSDLKRTLAVSTPGPKAFQSSLCEINLPYNRWGMSSPNLAERSRLVEVVMGTTSSVYYVHFPLCRVEYIRAGENIENGVSLGHVMDYVRQSVLDQYPGKVPEIYPCKLRRAQPPCSLLAKLYRAVKKSHPLHIPSRSAAQRETCIR